MSLAQIPATEPVPVAPETWLIPNLAAQGPDRYLPVNSLLVRGCEPVIVDTGAPIHRNRWLEQIFSLVEPDDVRWIFLSHDGGDHTAGLADALAMCPSATLVTNFFATERLTLERPLPLERLRFGPRPLRAPRLGAGPDPLMPDQHDRPAPDRQVPHRDRPAVLGHRDDTAVRAANQRRGRLHQQLDLAPDLRRGQHREPVQPEQHRRRATVSTHLEPRSSVYLVITDREAPGLRSGPGQAACPERLPMIMVKSPLPGSRQPLP